jgi:hypothetical protein
VNLRRETACEDECVIYAEEPDLPPEELLAAYKQLNVGEREFARLKGLLEL